MTPAQALFSAALALPIFTAGAVAVFPRAAQCLLACGALLLLAAAPSGFRGRPPLPLLLFFGVSFLSLLFSPYKHSAVPGFLTDASLAALFLIVSQGDEAFRKACGPLLAGIFVLTLGVHGWQAGRGGGFDQPWFNANVLAGVLLLLSPVALAELPGAFKALPVLAAVALVQTRSVPACVLFIAQMGALVWFLRGRGFPRFRWAGAAALAAGLLLFSAAVFLDGDRRAWWRAGWEIFRMNPFLGAGPGAFGEAFPGTIAGWPGWNTLLAHNFLIQLLADVGLLGAGAFAALLAFVFRRLGRPASPSQAGLWLGAVSFLVFNGIHVGLSVPGAAALFWVQLALLGPAPAGTPWGKPARAAAAACALLVAVLAFRAAQGDVWLDKALAATSAGDAELAAAAGLRWAPWEPEFHSVRGMARAGAGRTADAREEFRRAAEKAPSSARFQAELGDASEAGGDRAAALACYRRAAALLPLQPVYWMRLSELSDGDEAAAAARRALALVDGSDPGMIYQRIDPALRHGLAAAARGRLAALGDRP